MSTLPEGHGDMPFQVPGIRLGTAYAGIRKKAANDLLVIEAAAGATCAAVFTRNAFCAAPVSIARQHLESSPRWLLVNAGNANAGTGERGLDDARASCAALAALVGGSASEVLPFSTGVIGEFLPVDRLGAALPGAIQALSDSGWREAAQAIMTTDTRPKLASRRVELDGYPVVVTGISKGSGMIHPDMATMLAFICTDARVARAHLQVLLSEACDQTFNCITVDGDTSTNDACVLVASGVTGGRELQPESPEFGLFARAVHEVCADLAEAIVKDGEGATKLMRIVVEQALDESEARRVGMTVAHSPLVKTAFFASDPNWGRILAAVGRAGCPDLDIARIAIWLDDVCIVESGGRAASYTEEAGVRVMQGDEIMIRIVLGRGLARQTVLTCDFSYDYVKINAEYRT